ncbi:C1 family peptidase [Longimicrobium sp.]|uniref:C1 family peptidase n=1 Tax=Longimicrobium sp. TaxID=2029185 RepID=UPI002F94E015
MLATLAGEKRKLDARPDTLDFRDHMFVPTLVEVPTDMPLEEYLKARVPVLNQGREGACTGYALATVAHYLLRTRQRVPDTGDVSPKMLYDLARRYDEWPGEEYEGSSARGAMKAWQRHGVCGAPLWPDSPECWGDAATRPLGAYSRVNHRDLVAMHSAIAEARILYATALVHEGWKHVDAEGTIPFSGDEAVLGGHAFAIVAYDADGFWIQNSWGEKWGKQGFGHVSYDDWLQNGTDVWVARLGAPVRLGMARSTSPAFSDASQASRAYVYDDLRPHVVSLGNDGRLRPGGMYGTTEAEVARIVSHDIPRITRKWAKKRVMLYAHGGLVPEESALQRIADYRSRFLEAEVYPLAFIWRTDFWSTLKNILQDAFSRRRAEGFIGDAQDFMLDRLDDAMEPLARTLSGLAQWKEMKENARLATESPKGGAAFLVDELLKLEDVEIHIVAHSAGAVLMGPVVRKLAGARRAVETCTLWAPACTTRFFEKFYNPLAKDGSIRQFAVYTLTDKAEQDDHCARIYNKSLLYLVSHAFEERVRIPVLAPGGEPLLGMEKHLRKNAHFKALLDAGRAEWVRAPNGLGSGPAASGAKSHGGFDDDQATVSGTLARIVGGEALDGALLNQPEFRFRPSASRHRDMRRTLTHAS